MAETGFYEESVLHHAAYVKTCEAALAKARDEASSLPGRIAVRLIRGWEVHLRGARASLQAAKSLARCMAT